METGALHDLLGAVGRHARTLLDFALPPVCPVCAEPLRITDQGVCAECWERVAPPPRPLCPRCGLGGFEVDRRCRGCLREEMHFDLARQAARWEEPIPAMIHGLKYHSVAELADPLARLMAQLLVRDFPGRRWDLVVPVPLHRVRQRERGYNQSALLAKRLAGMFGWRFEEGFVRRTRPTKSQTHLSRAERLVNVTGAFRCTAPERLAGLHVLLIDDVHTTGSTLNETAKALKQAGAASVFALAATRAEL